VAGSELDLLTADLSFASRLAVKNVEPLQLYQKLELVRNGESFESVFKM
jgi:hypothetical protein